MEHVEVFTADGRTKGQTVLRSKAHSEGLWHRTVHVWVRNRRGELLLQRRSPAKEIFPGLWDISAAGHIAAGDSSPETAVRELREELGVKMEENVLQFLFTVKTSVITPDNVIKDNEITDVYLCTAPIEKEEITPDAMEVDDIAYHSIARLRELLVAQRESFVPHDVEYLRLFSLLAA